MEGALRIHGSILPEVELERELLLRLKQTLCSNLRSPGYIKRRPPPDDDIVSLV